MHVIIADSMNVAYEKLTGLVGSFGTPCNPRGLSCREVRPAALQLAFPTRGLYQGQSRRLNYRFFAVETLMYMAGWGDEAWHCELLCGINSRMKQFRNKITGLHDGAYGPRLLCSLSPIYDLLKRDPFSRQAVASIWEPEMLRDSKDVPCTLNLGFYRDLAQEDHPYAHVDPNKHVPCLAMTAQMRSNDLNWGTPYDVAAFCAIQVTMAGCLGWRVGTYTHLTNSLHVYADHPPLFRPYHEEVWNNAVIPNLTDPSCAGIFDSWIDFAWQAETFLEDCYEHLQRCRPWPAFQSSVEVAGLHAHHQVQRATYWAKWGNLIRWSWDQQ